MLRFFGDTMLVTRFGMLIEFLFEKFPNVVVVNDQAIGDLEAFYKVSKQRFDSDLEFKERAQEVVVSLQCGEEKYRKTWAQICEISRRGYQRVYQRLGIKIEKMQLLLRPMSSWSYNCSKQEEILVTAKKLIVGADASELSEEKMTSLLYEELRKWTSGCSFQIGPILLVDEPFTIDNGLMTPTMKIQRDKVAAQYKGQIDNLYK